MDAPTVIRAWLRETRAHASDWHLAVVGERLAVCGYTLGGPIAVALVAVYGFLPEPTCLRCYYWMRGDLASCEGAIPRM